MNILSKRTLIYIFIIFTSLLFIQTIYILVKLKSYMEFEISNKKEEFYYSAYLIHNLTDFTYDSILNRYDIREMMANIEDNISSKDKNRLALYEKLRPYYINLAKYNITQLQFHTKDNHSLLRFYNPLLYGDDLSHIRQTVVYVNRTQKPIDGFEVGRLVDGWRYVYPMFDNNGTHIGSVGVTTSTYNIKKMIEQRGPLIADIIIHRNIIIDKLIPSQYKKYTFFKWNSDFVESKDIVDYDRLHNRIAYKNKIYSNIIDKEVRDRMERGDEFCKFSMLFLEPKLVYFIPLKNPVTHKNNGYLVIIDSNLHTYHMFRYYYVMIFVVFIISIIIGIMLDKQIKLKDRMNRLVKLYKTILDFTENMIIVYSDGKIESMNRAFKRFIGDMNIDDINICSLMDLSMDRYLPCSIDEIIYRIERDGTVILFMKSKESGYTEEFEVIKHDINEDGKKRYIIEFKNISEIFEEKSELQKEVFTDYLTGLLNRKAFDGALLKAIQSVKRDGAKRSIIMLDIDYFKDINDRFGHETGDKALKFLAEILSDTINRREHIFRWGGEEFMILLDTDVESAIEIAEQLRERIEDASLHNPDIPTFTCSFGVIEIDENSTVLNILSRVDKALYRAKRAGRNRVVRGD